MKITSKKVPLSRILLDPNNYRFLDNPDWTRRQVRRFHDESVQNATLRLLERGARYQLQELRDSILANGYIPLDQVVVTEYNAGGKNYYLIVEGNRRIAALKTLIRDHEDGALTLTPEQKKEFSTIPVAILHESGDELLAIERTIMGIRHIAGPREWGAYQQAHFIQELVDEEGHEFTDIAEHLGLSRIETSRRYRAFTALWA